MNKKRLSVLPMQSLAMPAFEKYVLLQAHCQISPREILNLALYWWDELGDDGCCLLENREAAMERYTDLVCERWSLPRDPTYSEAVLLAHLLDSLVSLLIGDIRKAVAVVQTALQLRSIEHLEFVRLLPDHQVVVAVEGTPSET